MLVMLEKPPGKTEVDGAIEKEKETGFNLTQGAVIHAEIVAFVAFNSSGFVARCVQGSATNEEQGLKCLDDGRIKLEKDEENCGHKRGYIPAK